MAIKAKMVEIFDKELRVKAIAELEAVALVKQETENDKHWSCNSW